MKNRLKSKNRTYSYDDSGTPMDGVSNMSDVMLVLAVGIMLALVINWNIDIKVAYTGNEKVEILDEENLQEFETDSAKKDNEVSVEDIESNYVKSGTVYTDIKTGKTYVVID